MRSIVAIGIFFALFGCALDTVTSQYATLEEARADRLFERGWLPEVLPPSTTRIRTENELDLNLSEGTFSFEPAEANGLLNALSKGAPPTSRLADWDDTVSSYTGRGYSAWHFRDEDSTWASSAKRPRGTASTVCGSGSHAASQFIQAEPSSLPGSEVWLFHCSNSPTDALRVGLVQALRGLRSFAATETLFRAFHQVSP